MGRRARVGLGIAVLAALAAVPFTATRARRARATTPSESPLAAPAPASLADAVTALRAKLRRNPRHVPARALLAQAYLERGQWRLARAEAERAMASGVAPASVYAVRAAVREAAGDFEGAALDRRRVLLRDPENPQAWTDASRTLARYAAFAGCPEIAAEARRHLEQARERDPEAAAAVEVPVIPADAGGGAAPAAERAALVADVRALLRADPPDTLRARLLVDRHRLRWPTCPRGRALDAAVIPPASHDAPLLPDPETPPDVCLARGRVLLDAGEPVLARVWFERACARSTRLLRAWAHLAECLAAVGARETVLAAHARCDRHHPDAPTAPYFLGAFHLASGDERAAVDQFEVAHRRAPENADVLRALTIAALRARLPDRATAVLEGVEGPVATFLRAVVAEGRGDRAAAALLYAACTDGPEDRASSAGLLRTSAAGVPEALPEDCGPAACLERGLVALRAGSDLVAEPWISRAAAAAPGNLRARLAELCVARGLRRLEHERERITAEMERRPDDPLPAFLLATTERALGNREAARRRYTEALERDPGCGVAANGLAWILATDFGDPRAALPFARTARRALPDDPHVADTLGWTLFLLDDLSNAVAELERAACGRPGDAGVRRRLRRARAALQTRGETR